MSITKDRMTDEELAKLSERARGGDIAARNAIVEAYGGLVITIVNQFRRRIRGPSVSREDLQQEGTIGLIRAAELFDAGRGFQFSSYAAHWIKMRIRDAIQEGRLVAPPRMTRIKATTWQRLAAEGFDEPAIIRKLALQPGTVRTVKQAIEIDRGISTSLEGIYAEPCHEDDPSEALIAEAETEAIHKAMFRLRSRELEAICLHYGIGDGRPRTIAEVGARFSISRDGAKGLIRTARRQLAETLAG